MSKNSIKETEEKIKNYFFKENKIKLLKNTIYDLENQILNIQESIKDLGILEIEKIDIKSPNFENILSNNNSINSYIENGIINQVEEKEKLIKNINQKIENYKSEIEILKTESIQMRNIFNILSEEYKEMLILRYLKNKTETEIANKLNISISHYHNKKRKILKDIYNLMIMYKEI